MYLGCTVITWFGIIMLFDRMKEDFFFSLKWPWQFKPALSKMFPSTPTSTSPQLQMFRKKSPMFWHKRLISFFWVSDFIKNHTNWSKSKLLKEIRGLYFSITTSKPLDVSICSKMCSIHLQFNAIYIWELVSIFRIVITHWCWRPSSLCPLFVWLVLYSPTTPWRFRYVYIFFF